MLEIKVTVNCPELAELADAIRGRCAAPGAPAAPAAPTALTPPPAAPVVPVVPVTPASAPVTTPAPVSAPTMPVPTDPVSAPAAPVATPAPTAAPSYTSEQLAKVGADLVQAGKMPQLLALLAQYGVQAVTQLPPEQYGPFALALRGLGGNI